MLPYWWDEFPRARWARGRWFGPYRPFWITYSQTETSDILHIRSERRLRKEDVKVRFIEPDRIEIEIQRRPASEEIPIE
jgi:hypothetical protein